MRILSFLLVVVLAISSSFASEKGDFILQPNLNLGGWGGYAGYGGFGIGATLNGEYAVHDYASVGAWVGYNIRNVSNADYKYSRLGFGVRGVFHFWQLIDDKVSKDLKSDKIDFYLPAHLGYYTSNVRIDGNKLEGYKGNGASYGMGLGLRYYFTEKIGLGFEVGGMEMSWAKLGVAIKL